MGHPRDFGCKKEQWKHVASTWGYCCDSIWRHKHIGGLPGASLTFTCTGNFNVNKSHLYTYYVTVWYCTWCLMHYDHYWSIVLLRLSSPNIAVWQQPEKTPSSKAGETWREMSVNFAYKYLFHTVGILKCCDKLKRRCDNYKSYSEYATTWSCLWTDRHTHQHNNWGIPLRRL
jgi:hypothetical protein